MVIINRAFNPSNRYTYDFNICTTDKGWAQIDTPEDAEYFGNWINPFQMKIFSYVEGDTTEIIADSADELVKEFEILVAFYAEHHEKKIHIDPGFNIELKEKLCELGLEKYLQ